MRGNTLVLVEEVVDGGWGFADQVLTLGVRLLAAAAAVGALGALGVSCHRPWPAPAVTDLDDAAIGIWPPPARLDPRGRRLAASLAARARTTLPALDWHDTTASATVRKPSTGSGTCHGALLVATGRLDAFLLLGAGPWDIAALIPIVEEAGGAYSDLPEHRNGNARTALFSTPALHHQILDIAIQTSRAT